MHRDAIRLLKPRVLPTSPRSLTKGYLRVQMILFLNSLVHQPSRMCRTHRSSCRSSAIQSAWHTREPLIAILENWTDHAFRARGHCFLRKARLLRRDNGGALTEDITKQYQASSAEYLKAATSHPKDDERHACESCELYEKH
jgi:hypothetical protein